MRVKLYSAFCKYTLGWFCTGWPKKTGTLCFVRLNFIKYRLILKMFSLSESDEHLQDPTTPQVCRYTTLCNVLEATIENKTTSVKSHFKNVSYSSKADTLNN